MSAPGDMARRALDYEMIRTLVARYSLALDSRDIDLMVSLYVDDVDTETPNRLFDEALGRGHDALRTYFDKVLRTFHRSVHFIGTHVIDFVNDDTANGTVYAFAQEEYLDPPHWSIMCFVYDDHYIRVGGDWLFASRRHHRSWYTDQLGYPGQPALHRDPNKGWPPFLPFSWPTWNRFWPEQAGRSTSM